MSVQDQAAMLASAKDKLPLGAVEAVSAEISSALQVISNALGHDHLANVRMQLAGGGVMGDLVAVSRKLEALGLDIETTAGQLMSAGGQ
ncbi:hypothetical protein [Amycolatopsis dendrobii]|uniref:Uncharacterized protein n=1 Tax=Amycolatopsis dendrobii TaxID=2760662 RepID=A0A7W3VVS9_9PSEU|nr:hypothetical protein [Amycolatopsis dendrobii]MBB1153961.1 hypothetical protein [Amycolatopsis dendrobii]